MPRLKSTRVKTLRKKKKSKKIPAEFEDIAVYFSREEWGYLEEGQKELYRQVMMDNYQTFCTTGSHDRKPKLISRLEHGEDPTQRRPGRPPVKRLAVSSFQKDELFTPDGSAVEGLRLVDDLEEDLPIPVKKDSLDTKRRYNFRNRVGVKYSIFFDDEIRELKRKKGLRVKVKLSHDKIERIDGPMPDDKKGDMASSNCPPRSDASSHRSDELHTSLIKPDASAVEGIRLIDDLEEDLHVPVKVDSLDTKRRYNFRDRIAVEYSIFFDDEIRELKRKKGLRGKLGHDKIERINGLYPCSECGKKYKQKATLAIHQRLHTGVSCFVCMKCDKCFTHRSLLRRHEKIHAVKRPFACDDCEKRFSDSSTLQKHQRVHSGYKPYKCSECDKTFSITTYLIVHQRTHTGEKPYICDRCGKRFTQSSHLITHKRVHTGVRPYACIECGRGFTTSSHLITHQRTHTGEKPYQCKECGMAFNHSTHLVLHKRRHTGEKPFSCNKCKNKFSQRAFLQRHQKRYHDDDDDEDE